MGVVEFREMKIDGRFRNLLADSSLKGGAIWAIEEQNEVYAKIAPVKVRGREVNARRLSDGMQCWIAPSHMVESLETN